jgi:predicted nicotinamide N-methyase
VVEFLSDTRLFELLEAHAAWRPTSLVPELWAWQADDELPLWLALESEMGAAIPPPFFAVAWPGAQALALAIAGGRIDVRGLRVADVGAGSGLAGVAAMRAGAHSVIAFDIDPLARIASRELARRHGVSIETSGVDLLTDPAAIGDVDLVLAGDLVYEVDQAAGFRRAVERWRRHASVVLADSGRPFFDPCGLRLGFECGVPVAPKVDHRRERVVRVYAETGAL